MNCVRSLVNLEPGPREQIQHFFLKRCNPQCRCVATKKQPRVKLILHLGLTCDLFADPSEVGFNSSSPLPLAHMADRFLWDLFSTLRNAKAMLSQLLKQNL